MLTRSTSGHCSLCMAAMDPPGERVIGRLGKHALYLTREETRGWTAHAWRRKACALTCRRLSRRRQGNALTTRRALMRCCEHAAASDSTGGILNEYVLRNLPVAGAGCDGAGMPACEALPNGVREQSIHVSKADIAGAHAPGRDWRGAVPGGNERLSCMHGEPARSMAREKQAHPTEITRTVSTAAAVAPAL